MSKQQNKTTDTDTGNTYNNMAAKHISLRHQQHSPSTYNGHWKLCPKEGKGGGSH